MNPSSSGGNCRWVETHVVELHSQGVKDKRRIDTRRMRLTIVKALQGHYWQGKEQVSLTNVVHLEWALKSNIYTKWHACLLRACDTLEHVCTHACAKCE